MRIWFDRITLHDARLLQSWWNAHTLHNHVIRRSGRFYCLVRT